MDFVPTPSQTVGPFFHLCLTAQGSCTPVIAGPQVAGERIRLTFKVFDGDAAIVNDAMIEIWQADAGGKYRHLDHSQEAPANYDFRGFGRMNTDEQGLCEFETIKPGRVPGPGGALQAPHLNVAVFARGMLKQLYTRVYFGGDAANEQDFILSLVPKERQETLMAHRDPADPVSWRFDIHLQGGNETVFFDV